jgi:glycosyltransferase involved in cell wall biosynthesis
MDAALTRNYGVVQKTEVLSNAALMGEAGQFRQRSEVKTLGFLGALTLDKGILDFLEVAAHLVPEHPDLQFRIAGPCTDKSIQARVDAACQTYKNMTYVGAVYGDDKKEFLESLDVLLFPSTYRNEAEPFVIWEAQASGIPVIAPDRGCMGEMLRFDAHQDVVVPLDQSFVELTLKTIRAWLTDSSAYARRSLDVNRRFRSASIAAQRRFEQVFRLHPEASAASADHQFRSPKLIQIETCPAEPPISRPL